MDFTLLEIVTEVILEQHQKASSPISVTPSPIMKLALVSWPKMFAIVYREDRTALLLIVTEDKLLHSVKTPPPIEVTLLGMVTEIRLLQP